MGKITFITGGAKSGKSSFALKEAMALNKEVAFFATCIPKDDEMKKRVLLHKKERPKTFETFECETQIIKHFKNLKQELIIIDCLTLFISNLIFEEKSDEEIKEEIEKLAEELKKQDFKSFVVANEVGLGIVPDNPLARRFRDIAGISNQIMAKYADEVYFMTSGLPIKVK